MDDDRRPVPRIGIDPQARLHRHGTVLLGGAPWGVVRVGPAVAELARRLVAAGPAGVVPVSHREAVAAARLVERGLAHPVVTPAAETGDVEVVVPVLGRADLLRACLTALGDASVVVVDDGSAPRDAAAIAAVARRHGARLVRHPVNRGPAAARNTGAARTRAPVVAFVDVDCRVPRGWLNRLLPLFDDPRVGAVAPRIVPRENGSGPLARHERTRSALDLGPRRALVRYGARLGFVPSATLLVRRDALVRLGGFDERLRLGEDVDLVWRMADAGRLVRYEPAVRVEHEARASLRAWARRRFEYGTSAAALDRRHPGRLAPVRPSPWNLLTIAAAAAGRPRTAVAAGLTAAALLALRLRSAGVTPELAPAVVGAGTVADAAALGHALRREWWPLGWVMLAVAAGSATAPSRSTPSRPVGSPPVGSRGVGSRGVGSRVATVAAACMLGPVALEWWRDRPALDPLRYTAFRLLEDAAYGSGVIRSAIGGRRAAVLLPRIRWPRSSARHR